MPLINTTPIYYGNRYDTTVTPWEPTVTPTPRGAPLFALHFSAGDDPDVVNHPVLYDNKTDIEVIDQSRYAAGANLKNRTHGIRFKNPNDTDIDKWAANYGAQNQWMAYTFNNKMFDVWEVFEYLLPINYYHYTQLTAKFDPALPLDTNVWQKGMWVRVQNVDREIDGIKEYAQIHVIDNNAVHNGTPTGILSVVNRYYGFSNPWKAGAIIELLSDSPYDHVNGNLSNDCTPTGDTFETTDGLSVGSNNKWTSMHSGDQDDYSRGGGIMETLGSSYHSSGTLGCSYLKCGINKRAHSTNPDGSYNTSYPSTGDTVDNNLVEPYKTNGNKPLIYDPADAGKLHRFWVRRRRPSAYLVPDGKYEVYRQVDDGPIELLLAGYCENYNEEGGNNYGAGKIWSAQNSIAADGDQEFFFTDWEIWGEPPQELVDAGVLFDWSTVE